MIRLLPVAVPRVYHIESQLLATQAPLCFTIHTIFRTISDPIKSRRLLFESGTTPVETAKSLIPLYVSIEILRPVLPRGLIDVIPPE